MFVNSVTSKSFDQWPWSLWSHPSRESSQEPPHLRVCRGFVPKTPSIPEGLMAILKSIYYRSTFSRELRPSLGQCPWPSPLAQIQNGAIPKRSCWIFQDPGLCKNGGESDTDTQWYTFRKFRIIWVWNWGIYQENTIPRRSNSSFFHLRYCPSCASDKDLSSSRKWKADLATNARFILMPRRALWWQPMWRRDALK